MHKFQYRLLVFAAVALASCKFSPNVEDGRIHCAGQTECPSGYFCVGSSASSTGICCKNKSCASSLSPGQDGGGADGVIMTRLDSRGSDAPTNDASADPAVRDGAPDFPQESLPDVPYVADVAQSTGGSSSSGGMTGAGGATGTGGSIGQGGAPVTGGSTTAGGATNAGGVTSAGGITSKGGVTNSGGATSAGGAGGTTSMGGTIIVGGTTGAGGIVVTGGTTTLGGTTSAGGITAAGGTTGTGGSTSPCGVMPVSPNASAQAKNLLCYLYNQYGNHVLSGQQEANWIANPTDISWYISNGMKYPAILGSDFLYRDGVSCTSVTPSTTRGIAYWNARGLTMFRYHMGMPGAGLTCADDCFSGANCAEPSTIPTAAFFNAVVTNGTPENTSLNAKLDYMAVQIRAMQAANVPVILALFHETQPNGWFWWSQTPTGAVFVQLWVYAFNYLTQTKGLTNIIWLMPFSGSPSSAYYPGNSYVDISGADTYGTNQPFTALYTSCRAIMGPALPIALHETGLIPTPSAMFPSAAPWILFNIWAGYETSANTVANIQSVYADPQTITRDLIPNLK